MSFWGLNVKTSVSNNFLEGRGEKQQGLQHAFMELWEPETGPLS